MQILAKKIVHNTRITLLIGPIAMIVLSIAGYPINGFWLWVGNIATWFLSLAIIILFEYFSIKKLADLANADFDDVAYMVYEQGWQKGYIEENPHLFYAGAAKHLMNK